MTSTELSEDLTNNLKHIETKSNIKLFKKYNNVLILRDLDKIENECNRMKKKIIIEFSNDLKNLCNNNIELYKIKEMQEHINNNIYEIDNLINIILNLKNNENFIEVYEN
jgi:hypothetical protein